MLGKIETAHVIINRGSKTKLQPQFRQRPMSTYNILIITSQGLDAGKLTPGRVASQAGLWGRKNLFPQIRLLSRLALPGITEGEKSSAIKEGLEAERGIFADVWEGEEEGCTARGIHVASGSVLSVARAQAG